MAPLLAARLACAWEDLDAAVERAAGRTVAEILADDGEAAFREREASALRALLDGEGGRVIACGGGVTTFEPSRELLRRAATVIWLRVTPAQAVRRLGPEGLAARPLIAKAGGADSPEAGAAVLASVLRAREERYAACADLELDTAGRTPAEIAAAAADLLRERWDSSAS